MAGKKEQGVSFLFFFPSSIRFPPLRALSSLCTPCLLSQLTTDAIVVATVFPPTLLGASSALSASALNTYTPIEASNTSPPLVQGEAPAKASRAAPSGFSEKAMTRPSEPELPPAAREPPSSAGATANNPRRPAPSAGTDCVARVTSAPDLLCASIKSE